MEIAKYSIDTTQQAVRQKADEAVRALDWQGQYLVVDAKHIGLGNDDLFLDSSDFFTLDVADFIAGIFKKCYAANVE